MALVRRGVDGEAEGNATAEDVLIENSIPNVVSAGKG
jgi:hypothetical protein